MDRVVPHERNRASVAGRHLEETQLRIERLIEPARGHACDRGLAPRQPRRSPAPLRFTRRPLHAVDNDLPHRRRLPIGGKEAPESRIGVGAGTRVGVRRRDDERRRHPTGTRETRPHFGDHRRVDGDQVDGQPEDPEAARLDGQRSHAKRIVDAAGRIEPERIRVPSDHIRHPGPPREAPVARKRRAGRQLHLDRRGTGGEG